MSVKMVKANLNGLDELIIPSHRAERPDWYMPDGWEKKRHQSLKDNVKKGDVIYYVGAEEGEFPALCSKWGADVVMFEPNPKVWGNIKAIWQSNKLKTPVSYCAFASNDDKIVDADNFCRDFPIYADEPPIGNHGFKELYLEAQNYNQVKIDTIASANPPTVLIMDVEGSEYEVLKGARHTLETYKPKIYLSLHPEFLIQQWGIYGREVRDFIIGLGYKETLLDYQHEVHLFYESI